MHIELRQAYDMEMQVATKLYDGGNLEKAFFHFERAHILANRLHSLMQEHIGGC